MATSLGTYLKTAQRSDEASASYAAQVHQNVINSQKAWEESEAKRKANTPSYLSQDKFNEFTEYDKTLRDHNLVYSDTGTNVYTGDGSDYETTKKYADEARSLMQQATAAGDTKAAETWRQMAERFDGTSYFANNTRKANTLKQIEELQKQIDVVTKNVENYNKSTGPIPGGDDYAAFINENETLKALKQQLKNLNAQYASYGRNSWEGEQSPVPNLKTGLYDEQVKQAQEADRARADEITEILESRGNTMSKAEAQALVEERTVLLERQKNSTYYQQLRNQLREQDQSTMSDFDLYWNDDQKLYNVGDRISAVISSAAQSIGSGLLNYAGTAFDIGEAAAKKITGKGIEEDSILYGVSDKLHQTADNLHAESQLNQYLASSGQSKATKFLHTLGINAIQMGFDLASAAATGGSSLGVMFERVAGEAAGEARRNKADLSTQVLYGTLEGTKEVLTEKIFGVFDKFGYGKGFTGGWVEKAVSNFATKPWAMSALRNAANALGEGVEEVLANGLDPFVRVISGYNTEGLSSDAKAFLSAGQFWNLSDSAKAENLESFLVGAALGAAGSVGNVVSGGDALANRSVYNQLADQATKQAQANVDNRQNVINQENDAIASEFEDALARGITPEEAHAYQERLAPVEQRQTEIDSGEALNKEVQRSFDGNARNSYNMLQKVNAIMEAVSKGQGISEDIKLTETEYNMAKGAGLLPGGKTAKAMFVKGAVQSQTQAEAAQAEQTSEQNAQVSEKSKSRINKIKQGQVERGAEIGYGEQNLGMEPRNLNYDEADIMSEREAPVSPEDQKEEEVRRDRAEADAIEEQIRKARGLNDEDAPPIREEGPSEQDEADYEAFKQERRDRAYAENERLEAESRRAEQDKTAEILVERERKAETKEVTKQLRNALVRGEIDNKPVSTVSKDAFIKVEGEKITDKVSNFFKQLGNKVRSRALGRDVIIDEAGVRSSIAHGLGRIKSATFAAVPDVLQNGQQIGNVQKNWKGRGYDTVMIGGAVSIDGKLGYLGCVVTNVQENGQPRYYLHEVVDQDGNLIFSFDAMNQGNKNTLAVDVKTGIAQGDTSATAEGNNSLANQLENVNTSNNSSETALHESQEDGIIDADEEGDDQSDGFYEERQANLERNNFGRPGEGPGTLDQYARGAEEGLFEKDSEHESASRSNNAQNGTRVEGRSGESDSASSEGASGEFSRRVTLSERLTGEHVSELLEMIDAVKEGASRFFHVIPGSEWKDGFHKAEKILDIPITFTFGGKVGGATRLSTYGGIVVNINISKPYRVGTSTFHEHAHYQKRLYEHYNHLDSFALHEYDRIMDIFSKNGLSPEDIGEIKDYAAMDWSDYFDEVFPGKSEDLIRRCEPGEILDKMADAIRIEKGEASANNYLQLIGEEISNEFIAFSDRFFDVISSGQFEAIRNSIVDYLVDEKVYPQQFFDYDIRAMERMINDAAEEYWNDYFSKLGDDSSIQDNDLENKEIGSSGINGSESESGYNSSGPVLPNKPRTQNPHQGVRGYIQSKNDLRTMTRGERQAARERTGEINSMFGSGDDTVLHRSNAQRSDVADERLSTNGVYDPAKAQSEWQRLMNEDTVWNDDDMVEAQRLMHDMLQDATDYQMSRTKRLTKDQYNRLTLQYNALRQRYNGEKSSRGQELQAQYMFTPEDRVLDRARQVFLGYSKDGIFAGASPSARNAKIYGIIEDATQRITEAREKGDAQALAQIVKDISYIRGQKKMFGPLGDTIEKAESKFLDSLVNSKDSVNFLYSLALGNTNRVCDDVQALSGIQAAKTIRIMNMLSNGATIINNLGNNAASGLTGKFAQTVGAAADTAFAEITGHKALSKAGRSAITDSTVRDAAVDALHMGVLMQYYGISVKNGKTELSNPNTFNPNGGFVEQMLAITKFLSGVGIETTDYVKAASLRASMQEGIDADFAAGKITQEVKEAREREADHEVNRQLFKEDNQVTKTIDFIRRGMNKVSFKDRNGGQFGLGDLVMPFAKVPTNVVMHKLEATPYGALWNVSKYFYGVQKAKSMHSQAIAYNIANDASLTNVQKWVKAKADCSGSVYKELRRRADMFGGTVEFDRAVEMAGYKDAKEMSVYDQARYSRGIGRAATTAGMIALGAVAQALGALKDFDLEPDDDIKKLNKSKGYTGLMLNLSALTSPGHKWNMDGDLIIDANWLEVIAMPLAIGASIWESYSNGEGFLKAAFVDGPGSALLHMMDAIGDVPGMQQVSNVYNAIANTNWGNKDITDIANGMGSFMVEQAANDVTSFFIPNVFSQASAGLDNTVRDVYTTNNAWQRGWNIIKNKGGPAVRGTIPASVDVWGNTRTYGDTTAMGVINKALLPGDVKTYRYSDTEQTLIDLQRTTGKHVLPNTGYINSFTVGDTTIELSGDDKRAFRDARTDAQRRIEQFVHSDDYDTLTDAQRTSIIYDLKSDSTNYAKNYVLQLQGRNLEVDHESWADLPDSKAQRDYLIMRETVGGLWNKETKSITDYDAMDEFISGKYAKASGAQKELLNNKLSYLDDLESAAKAGISAKEWQTGIDIWRKYEDAKTETGSLSRGAEVYGNQLAEIMKANGWKEGADDAKIKWAEENWVHWRHFPTDHQTFDKARSYGVSIEDAANFVTVKSEIEPPTGYDEAAMGQVLKVMAEEGMPYEYILDYFESHNGLGWYDKQINKFKDAVAQNPDISMTDALKLAGANYWNLRLNPDDPDDKTKYYW